MKRMDSGKLGIQAHRMIVVITVMLGASFSKAEQSSRIEESEEYALPESKLVESISFILSLKKLHSIYQTGNAGDTGTRSSQFTSSISGEKTYRYQAGSTSEMPSFLSKGICRFQMLMRGNIKIEKSERIFHVATEV